MESGGRREEQECAVVFSRCSEDVVEEASHGLDEEGCAERAGAKGGHAPPTTEARGLGADEPKEDGYPQSSLLAQVQKYQLRHRGCSAGAVGASEDSETDSEESDSDGNEEDDYQVFGRMTIKAQSEAFYQVRLQQKENLTSRAGVKERTTPRFMARKKDSRLAFGTQSMRAPKENR